MWICVREWGCARELISLLLCYFCDSECHERMGMSMVDVVNAIISMCMLDSIVVLQACAHITMNVMNKFRMILMDSCRSQVFSF